MKNQSDSRTKLLNLLSEFELSYPSQSAEAQSIMKLVREELGCADRTTFSPGHLTGSALLTDRSRERVLLLHHKKLDRWLQPGGHADGELDLSAVALRESREESGLQSVRLLSNDIFDVDIHCIPARPTEPEHFHFDVRFLIEADEDEPLILNGESKALAWVNLSDVTRYTTEESVLRMTRRLMEMSTRRDPRMTSESSAKMVSFSHFQKS